MSFLKWHLQEFEGQKIGFLRPLGRVDMLADRWGISERITIEQAIKKLQHPTADLFLLWELLPTHASFHETEKNRISWIIAYESNKYWLVQSSKAVPLCRWHLNPGEICTFCNILDQYPALSMIPALQTFLEVDHVWKFSCPQYELTVANVVRARSKL